MGALDKITHTEKKLGEFLKPFIGELRSLKKEVLGTIENPVKKAKKLFLALWKLDAEGNYSIEKISLKARKEVAIANPAYNETQQESEKYSMKTIIDDDISSDTVYSYSQRGNKIYANIDYNYDVGVEVPEMGIVKRVICYDLDKSIFSSKSYFKNKNDLPEIIVEKHTNGVKDFNERILAINARLEKEVDYKIELLYFNIWKILQSKKTQDIKLDYNTKMEVTRCFKKMTVFDYTDFSNRWIKSISDVAYLDYRSNHDIKQEEEDHLPIEDNKLIIIRESADPKTTVTEIIDLEDFNSPVLNIEKKVRSDDPISYVITDKLIILEKLQEIMSNL